MNILHIFTFATLISSLAACGQGNVEENVGLNVDTSVTESTGTSDSDVENVVSPSEHSGIANTPSLMEGMTGVFWDSDGVEHSVTEENKESWYNYLEQTGTEDGKASRWANAKTQDGSYWVWIPRYEYQLDEKSQIISINFMDTTQTTASDGYKIHPAFEDGSENGKNNHYMNGEWDSELSGFWVAKHEMSDNSGVPASVSGVTSWRNISIEDSYHISQSIASKVQGLNPNITDSHLMKNSEWGAVAYLSHSAYGRNGTEITVNKDNSYTTAGEKGATALTHKNQSTTGNETGVFDMSGGVWERVAGYMSNGNANITKNASTIPNIVTKRDDTAYLDQSTKYLTVYPFDGDGANSSKNYESFEQKARDTYGYGDGILEVSSSGSGLSTWNHEMSAYFHVDDLFFLRGGNYYNGASGLFAFNVAGGGADSNLGFRAVLVEK